MVLHGELMEPDASILIRTPRDRVTGSFEAALYRETHGESRSALNSPARDLTIFGMRVRTGYGSPVEMTVTPISLHQRRRLLGVERLGVYGELTGGLNWTDRMGGLFDSALGPTMQLYGSGNGRADISLGALTRVRYHPSIGWHFATPGIATVTVPLLRSALRALGTYVRILRLLTMMNGRLM